MGEISGSSLFCSKNCLKKFLKDQTSRPSWTNDAAPKKNDGDEEEQKLSSADILLQWWLEPGNYAKFRGKGNNGIRKMAYAEKLASKMNQAKVRVKRDAKQVINKIKHIEDQFRRAHDFANTETGAGIKQNEGEKTFADAVMKICPYYYDLFDVMADRASAKPKATNYDTDDELDAEIKELEGELDHYDENGGGQEEVRKALGGGSAAAPKKKNDRTSMDTSISSSSASSSSSKSSVVQVIEVDNEESNNDKKVSANAAIQKKTPSKKKPRISAATGPRRSAEKGGSTMELLNEAMKTKIDDIYTQRLTKETLEVKVAKLKTLTEIRKDYPNMTKEDIKSLFPELNDTINIAWKE